MTEEQARLILRHLTVIVWMLGLLMGKVVLAPALVKWFS